MSGELTVTEHRVHVEMEQKPISLIQNEQHPHLSLTSESVFLTLNETPIQLQLSHPQLSIQLEEVPVTLSVVNHISSGHSTQEPPAGSTFIYSDGRVSQLIKGSVTKDFTYHANGQIATVSDGTYTKTFHYNGHALSSITLS